MRRKLLCQWPTLEFIVLGSCRAEVEKSSYCRDIIRLRIQEKLLPPGTVEEDARTVVPPSSARGVGGGFPCQAGRRKLFG